MSPDETLAPVLAVATSLKARVLLSLSYGCGLRGGEVIRLKVKHIRPRAEDPVRIEHPGPQAIAMLCCRREPSRSVAAMVEKVRRGFDAATPLPGPRWLFPGRKRRRADDHPPLACASAHEAAKPGSGRA